MSKLLRRCIELVIAFFPLFIPSDDLKIKIIIVLSIVIADFAFEYYDLYKKHQQITQMLKQRIERHEALARQFDTNFQLLNSYRNAFKYFRFVLLGSTLKTEKLKVENIFKLLDHVIKQINDSEEKQ